MKEKNKGMVVSDVFRGGKKVAALARWHTGRIRAMIGKKEVLLERRYGEVGNYEIRLDSKDLLTLDIICQHWKEIRDRWAAFFYSSAGLPPGFGMAWYYWPRGKGSKYVRIGESRGGQLHSGHGLQGHEVEKESEKAAEIVEGVSKVADLFWVGETVGNPLGELIGEKYRISADLLTKAKRNCLEIHSRGKWTTIEPDDEEDLIKEIALYLKNWSD